MAQAAPRRAAAAAPPKGASADASPSLDRRTPGEPKFRVVTARDLAARSRHRRARAVVACAGMLVIGSLLAIAVGQALVASQQVRLDAMHQQLSAAVASNQELQIQRAKLASPARILDLAKTELKMVTPSSVTYLPAVLPSELGVSTSSPTSGGVAPATTSSSVATSTIPTRATARSAAKPASRSGRKRP